METTSVDFNWKIYKSGYQGDTKLTENFDIRGLTNKDKVYSREPYVQELFDIYTSTDSQTVKKDLERGDYVRVKDIISHSGTNVVIELMGGLTLDIDLNKEKKFIQMFGFDDIDDFITMLSDEENMKIFLSQNIKLCVLESEPNVKVSLWEGYIKSIRDEFMDQIQHPTKAYTCKVVEANKGGFFVKIQGVDAFMPGSLAAPNKIADFQSYVGKEVIVMVEDFLKEMNSFIVSHKKYIDYILPQKLSELDLNTQYTGTITGTSKFGIFIEFENFYTSLLHTTKMSANTLARFNDKKFNPGEEIDFYISEITSDKRIICTEESPTDRLDKIQKFIVENSDKRIQGTIVAILPSSIIVKVSQEISGLILAKDFKKNKIAVGNYSIGELINVKYSFSNNDKLFFEIV